MLCILRFIINFHFFYSYDIKHSIFHFYVSFLQFHQRKVDHILPYKRECGSLRWSYCRSVPYPKTLRSDNDPWLHLDIQHHFRPCTLVDRYLLSTCMQNPNPSKRRNRPGTETRTGTSCIVEAVADPVVEVASASEQ